MTDSQFTLAERAMQTAAIYAREWFRDPHDILDAVHEAWLMAQSGKGNPVSIARYAIRRVRSKRHFAESARSLHYRDQYRQGPKPGQIEFELDSIFRTGDDPARIAEFLIDYREWLESLPERIRQIAELMAQNESTRTIAQTAKLSPARISQLRRELHQSWNEFHGELTEE